MSALQEWMNKYDPAKKARGETKSEVSTTGTMALYEWQAKYAPKTNVPRVNNPTYGTKMSASGEADKRVFSDRPVMFEENLSRPELELKRTKADTASIPLKIAKEGIQRDDGRVDASGEPSKRFFSDRPVLYEENVPIFEPVRTTTKSGFYSMQSKTEEEIENETQLKNSAIIVNGQLNGKVGELEIAASQITERDERLTSLKKEAERLYDAYMANPSDTLYAMYERVFQSYEQEYVQREKAVAGYKQMYSEYESLVGMHNAVLKPYRAYVKKEQAEYDAWRGSIRSAEEIEAERAEVEAQLEAAEIEKAKLVEQIQRADPNYWTKEYSYDSWHRHNLDAQMMWTEQIEGLQNLLHLLDEEDGYRQYFYYEDLRKNEDFAEKSKYVPIASETPSDNDKKAYELVNAFWKDKLYMEKEELGIFNYLYALDSEAGDTSHTRTREFMNYLFNGTVIYEGLRQRRGKAIADNIDTDFGRVLYGFVVGLDRFATGVKQLFHKEALPTTATQYAGMYAREELGTAGKFFYDFVQTTGNMTPSILLSVATKGMASAILGTGSKALTVAGTAGKIVGTGSMGLSAAGNAYNEAIKAGYDPGDARLYAFLIGASESTLEYAIGGIKKLGGGGGKLFAKKIAGIDKAFLRFAAHLGTSMLSEGTEEGLQTILEPLFATIALDEKYTPADIDEIAYSFLLGAVSGGFFEVTDAKRTASMEGALQKAGAEVRKMDRGMLEKLVETGLEAGKGTAAYDVALEIREKLEKGETITDFVLGKMYAEAVKENPDVLSGATEKTPGGEDVAGENTGVKKGRTAEEKAAAQKKVYDGARVRVGMLSEERQQYLADKHNEFKSVLEDVEAGDVLLDEDGEVVGVVRVKTEDGFTVVGDILTEIVLSDTFTDDAIIDGLEAFGWHFEKPGNAGTEVEDPGDIGHVREDADIVPSVNSGSSTVSDKGVPTPKFDAQGNLILPTEADRELARRYANAKTETERTGIAHGATDADIAMAERLSKILNRKILFYRESAINGKIRNGMFDTETGTIYVNVESKRKLEWIVAHELTHSIERAGSYGTMLDGILSYMRQTGEDVDALVKEKIGTYAETDSALDSELGAQQEIAADFIADKLLTDEKAIRDLVRAKPKVGRAILNFFDRILAKLGGKGAKARTEEYAFFERTRARYAAALREVQWVYDEGGTFEDISDEAFYEHVETMEREGTQEDVKSSIENLSEKKRALLEKNGTFLRNKYFDRQVDQWRALRGRYITVGKIFDNSVLCKVGVPSGNLYFDLSKLESELTQHGDHLDESIIKDIPRLLDDPMVIVEYQPGAGSNTLSVYGDLYANNNTGLLITVGIIIKRGRNGNLIAKVRTAHGRKDFENQCTDKSVLYLKDNKKEINAWFQARGIDVPLGGTQLGVIRSIDFKDSIPQSEADVNNEVSTVSDIFDEAFYGHVETMEREEGDVLSDAGIEDERTLEVGWKSSIEKVYDPETASIKEQLENSRERLNSMDVVASATVPIHFKSTREVVQWATELLKKTGYKVDRQGFGVIQFEVKHINDAAMYAKTDAEKAAMAVLPAVLKRGIIIGEHADHKGRGLSTVTIAAPVELNGIRGNMAVVVKGDKKYYKSHRIVLPDGSEFVFSESAKKDTVPGPQRGGAVSDSLANATSTVSKNSIPQPTPTVKHKSSIEYDKTADKGEIVRDLRAILERGGDASELRRYVETLERGDGRAMDVRAEEADTDTPEGILREAKAAGMSVEQYLRENAELYETEDGWNETARRALDMERRGRMRYSVEEVEAETGITPETDAEIGEYYRNQNEVPQKKKRSTVDSVREEDRQKRREQMRYSIEPAFASELDSWDGEEVKTFRIGNTSEVLHNLGVEDRTVFLRSEKVKQILKKHEGMTREIIKQVPDILERPIMVLNSRSVVPGNRNSSSRIVMFGEVYDANGAPVTAILELRPTTDGGELLNYNLLVSTYGKTKNFHKMVEESDVLYLDPDKNRTDTWLQGVRLQSPSYATAYGSIGSISYVDGFVNIQGVPWKELIGKSENGRMKSSIETVEAVREEERQKRQEEIARQREARKLRELQQKTLKQLRWLSKNRYRAPEDFKARWDEVLGNIDLFAIGAANEMHYDKKREATWRDLAEMYKRAKEEDPNFLPSAELERIVARLDGDKIADMDVGALADLYKAAVGIRTEFYNRNNVLLDKEMRLFAEVYEDSKRELTSTPGKHSGSFFDKLLNGEQLTPMNVFRRMVGWKPDSVFYSMAKQLEAGERDIRDYTVRANRMLADFLKKEEKWVKRADGQGKDGIWIEKEVPQLLALRVGEKPKFGGTVTITMTPLQRVHLYLESKNVDNLRHMTGGRTFADKDLYSRGKRQEAFAQGTTVRLAPETVKWLVSDLTEKELELAGILEKYYNEYATGEINRVSNALYGYDKAMGQHYAPIYTNKNYTKSEIGVFDVTAEGIGNLKTRKHAVNPTYNIGAFDAFEKHVERTARFVGMAIPARNWQVLLNWREDGNSMADVITHKWGEDGKRYITDLIEVLQSGGELERDVISAGAEKLMSNYISAIFGANPSIVLKQFGSMAMAMPELGIGNIPKPTQIGKIDKNLIAIYTSELAWRGMGYATPETKQLKDNPNVMETNKVLKFTFGGGAITAVDQAAASVLWPWAENKVKKEHPDLAVGTKEQIDAGESPFYKKVAEEFNAAVAQSQSVSDEAHQSKLRKSKNPITRAFTMFKSDAAQGYNQLRRTIGEARYLKRTGAEADVQRKANKKVGEAVLGILASNAWAAGVTFLVALWKNGAKKYRDDEEELTWSSVLWGMSSDFFSNLSGLFIGGEELAEVIGNVVTGDRWYGIDVPGMEQATDLVELITGTFTTAGDLLRGGWNVYREGGDVGKYISRHVREIIGGVKDLAGAFGMYFMGLPVSNLEAYLFGLIQHLSPGLAVAYEDLFETAGKSDLNGLKGNALKTRVGSILTGRGIDASSATISVIAELYEAGFKGSVPSDTPDSITIEGTQQNLSAAQKQKFESVWAETVNDHLSALVASDAFEKADDESRAMMIGKLYQYGREHAKAALFDDYEVASWAKEVDAFASVRMDLTEYLEVMDAYTEIYDREIETYEIGIEFARWVRSQKYTESQLKVIRESFAHNAGRYYDFMETGMSDRSAYDLAVALGALEPVPGKKSVSAIQKYRTVIDADLTENEEMAALSVLMTESDYAKVETAQEFGISPSIYVVFKEQLLQYDLNGNGSYSQAEVEDALDGMGATGVVLPSKLPPTAKTINMTNAQRAVLWQLANKSWKPDGNPYSVTIGRRVYEAMNGN